MSKRRILLLTLIVLAFAAVVIRYFATREAFVYAGTIEATRVDLAPRVASSISAVRVWEGDKIQAGQVLIELGCEDIQIASRLANEEYERGRKLFRVGSIPQETFDQLTSRKQDLDLRISWCTIRSPIDGTVLARYHEPAEWAGVGTRILTVANIKEIWAYLYVPQPQVSRLSYGMKVTGRLPELDNRPFEGRIVWINDQAEFTPKNVQTREERTRLVYAVKVRFENEREILKPGMTVEVSLPE